MEGKTQKTKRHLDSDKTMLGEAYLIDIIYPELVDSLTK